MVKGTKVTSLRTCLVWLLVESDNLGLNKSTKLLSLLYGTCPKVTVVVQSLVIPSTEMTGLEASS